MYEDLPDWAKRSVLVSWLWVEPSADVSTFLSTVSPPAVPRPFCPRSSLCCRSSCRRTSRSFSRWSGGEDEEVTWEEEEEVTWEEDEEVTWEEDEEVTWEEDEEVTWEEDEEHASTSSHESGHGAELTGLVCEGKTKHAEQRGHGSYH